MKAEDRPEHQEASLSKEEITFRADQCEKEMKLAAKEMRFEDAAKFRDMLRYYQDLLMQWAFKTFITLF